MEPAHNATQEANGASHSYFKPLKNLDSSSQAKSYKTALLDDKIIFFGKSWNSKNDNMLKVFDLRSAQWSDIQVRGCSALVGEKEDYSVCVTPRNQIILCGSLLEIKINLKEDPVSPEPIVAPSNGNQGDNQGGNQRSGGFFASRQDVDPFRINKNKDDIFVEQLSLMDAGLTWKEERNKVGVKPNCYAFHSANVFEDKMYVYGGVNQNGDPIDDLYEYSLALKTWTLKNVMHNKPNARFKHSTCIHQEKLYVFGGRNLETYFNDLWSLDLKTNNWKNESLQTRLAPLISSQAFLFAYKQNIIIFGGPEGCKSISASLTRNEVFFLNTERKEWKSCRIGPNYLSTFDSVVQKKNGDFIIYGGTISELPLDLSQLGEKENDELDLAREMKDLFQRQDCYDFKFKVEGREIPVYKGILISRSRYFARRLASLNLFNLLCFIQIDGMMEIHNQEIDVPEVKYEVFHKLIEYIYCGKIEIQNEIAEDLLKLSHEYELPLLTKKCGKSLGQTINRENFLDLANLAEHYDVKSLQEYLLAYFMDAKSLLLNQIGARNLPRFLLVAYMENAERNEEL